MSDYVIIQTIMSNLSSSIAGIILMISLSISIFSCVRSGKNAPSECQDERRLKLKNDLDVIGEYGLIDTNLFSRSLLCIYPSTTTTIVIRISELKEDTCSTMSLAYVRYRTTETYSKSDKNAQPFLVVKNLRRISKAQSNTIFSLCDDYVRNSVFYPWGHPSKKVKPGEYTMEEGDRIVYTKIDSLYEYCYYDYPKSIEIEKFYAKIDEVCNFRGMADDMKFPWIDDKGYFNEKWEVVGGK